MSARLSHHSFKLYNVLTALAVLFLLVSMSYFYKMYEENHTSFYALLCLLCGITVCGLCWVWIVGFGRIDREFEAKQQIIATQEERIKSLSEQISMAEERSYLQITWQNNWLYKFQATHFNEKEELTWLARCITELTSASLGGIMQFDATQGKLEGRAFYFAPTQMAHHGFTLQRQDYPALFDIVQGYTPITLPIQPQDDWLHHFGVTLAAAYPIYVEKKLFGGVLAFQTDNPVSFNTRQHALLEWIAQSVGLYLSEIEHRKLKQELTIFKTDHQIFKYHAKTGIAYFKPAQPIKIKDLKFRTDRLLQIPLKDSNPAFLEMNRIPENQTLSLVLDEVIGRYTVPYLLEQGYYTTEKIVPDGNGDIRFLKRHITLHQTETEVCAVWITDEDITDLKTDGLFYRSLSEQTGCIQVVTDNAGRIIFDNQTATNKLGWQPNERKGKSIYSFVLPKDGERLALLAQKAIETESTQFFCDIGLQTSFGEPIQADGIISFHCRPHQEIKGLLFEFYHAAARIEQAQNLKREADFYRHLTENNGVAVTLLSQKGIIQYESKNIFTLFGYAPEIRIGKDGFEYFSPDDTYLLHKNFQIASKTRRPVVFDANFRNSSGEWRKVEITFVNLLEEASVKGILMIWQDITHIIKQNTPLKKI